jgi:hypothetical protein
VGLFGVGDGEAAGGPPGCAFIEGVDFGVALLMEEGGDVLAADSMSTDDDHGLIGGNCSELVGDGVHGDMEGVGEVAHAPFPVFADINEGVVTGVEALLVAFDGEIGEVAGGHGWVLLVWMDISDWMIAYPLDGKPLWAEAC